MTSERMECHGDYLTHFSQEFLEFLEKYEFHSLIPNGMETTHDESLEYETICIDEDSKVQKLIDQLKKTKTLSLRTV